MRMRTEKVSLKLSNFTSPVELSFSQEEMRAIDEARNGVAKSRFIRELVVVAAKTRIKGDESLEVPNLLAAAAEDARLSIPEFIRLVCLGAIGFCPLAWYLHAGAEAYDRYKSGG